MTGRRVVNGKGSRQRLRVGLREHAGHPVAGHVEGKEALAQAAHRECLEEIGVDFYKTGSGELTNLPLIVMMLVGGIISGLVGVGTGYLTLRLRGTFFSIATLAMAVVMQTLVTNWEFVDGVPEDAAPPSPAIEANRRATAAGRDDAPAAAAPSE